MLIFPSFSYFPLLVTLALLSCCIQAPAQIPSPASYSPFCNLLSAQYVSLLSKKEPPSNYPTVLTDVYGRNLTLFSFTLPANISSSASSTFTITYSPEDDLQGAFPGPTAAFILARSPLLDTAVSSVQVSFSCIPYMGCFPMEIPCNSTTPPQKDLQMQASIEPDDGHEESLRKDELSFTYLVSSAELRVEVVHYRDGLKIEQVFSLSLLADASNESATFFVGYITTGEAISIGPSGPKDDDNTKHIRVMAWVVVGTLVMGTLFALIILVLFIMKGPYKGPQVVSSPQYGSPPLARRAAFSHHADLESSETLAPPHIHSNAFQMPAPIHSNAFQISGTASWFKQPNPR